MGNLEYEPMKVCDLPRFEKLNPTISITVLCVEDEADKDARGKKRTIFPLYCPQEKKEHHITLLLISDEGRQHYVLVRDIHAFLASQSRNEHRRFYCCYCLNRLQTEEKLEEHEKVCRQFGAQKTEYAKPGSYEVFDSRRFPKMQRVPFTAYYDWESVLVPLPADGDATTVRTQRHDPVGYSIVVVDWQGNVVRTVTHSGEKDVGKHFVDTVLELEKELWDMRPNFPLHMSAQQQADFERVTSCYLCGKGFKSPQDRVREHERLQERDNFRGPAHAECNSAIKRTTFLPLVAHNGFRYDVHHVFRAFIQHPKLVDKRVTVLAKTHDTYRSATIFLGEEGRSIKLLDSFQFFSSSLDGITKNLQDEDLKLLFQEYPDPQHQALLRQKGVFCYEHVRSYKQLCDETRLPPREAFYSSLTRALPSEEEYARAQQVWDGLGCRTLLDYMTHYLKSDVLLLASFFTKFKAMTYAKYGLEVCHFVSASSLSWCQALKFTKAEVQLIDDPDMYQFFELQKRGGMSCVMKRYAEANVPGPSTYDPSLPNKYLYLWDVNALYSHEMCKKLPVGDFKWVDAEALALVDWKSVSEDDNTMYTVEVDLEYDESLFESHNEWPCAVERCTVPREWYSPYQQELAKNLPEGQLKQPKLVAHLGPRKNYIVHGAVLARYLQLGMRVTRFHRGVRYRQESWLKSYIEDLMDARKKTKLPFEVQALVAARVHPYSPLNYCNRGHRIPS
ncbi:uncharacterized protein LOC117653286 [Thrips palmi]|uniref:DNA-directed DNA polymerase n=1 Tax=Thrips palmi TaxID=161013 RepID=A0A6P9ABA9_THRPL|nr:uncharacterized protein LOC117653286 [Thrips palmi]